MSDGILTDSEYGDGGRHYLRVEPTASTQAAYSSYAPGVRRRFDKRVGDPAKSRSDPTNPANDTLRTVSCKRFGSECRLLRGRFGHRVETSQDWPETQNTPR